VVKYCYVLDCQSRKYTGQWEGWLCSQFCSNFANYQRENSSKRIYSSHFTVLPERTAEYLEQLLQFNRTLVK